MALLYRVEPPQVTDSGLTYEYVVASSTDIGRMLLEEMAKFSEKHKQYPEEAIYKETMIFATDERGECLDWVGLHQVKGILEPELTMIDFGFEIKKEETTDEQHDRQDSRDPR